MSLVMTALEVCTNTNTRLRTLVTKYLAKPRSRANQTSCSAAGPSSWQMFTCAETCTVSLAKVVKVRINQRQQSALDGKGNICCCERGLADMFHSYTVVATGCTLKPPARIHRGQMTYYPMRIGDNVFIGMHLFQSNDECSKSDSPRPKCNNLISIDKFALLHRRKGHTFAFLHHQRKLQNITRHCGSSAHGGARWVHCRRRTRPSYWRSW